MKPDCPWAVFHFTDRDIAAAFAQSFSLWDTDTWVNLNFLWSTTLLSYPSRSRHCGHEGRTAGGCCEKYVCVASLQQRSTRRFWRPVHEKPKTSQLSSSSTNHSCGLPIFNIESTPGKLCSRNSNFRERIALQHCVWKIHNLNLVRVNEHPDTGLMVFLSLSAGEDTIVNHLEQAVQL